MDLDERMKKILQLGKEEIKKVVWHRVFFISAVFALFVVTGLVYWMSLTAAQAHNIFVFTLIVTIVTGLLDWFPDVESELGLTSVGPVSFAISIGACIGVSITLGADAGQIFLTPPVLFIIMTVLRLWYQRR